MRTIFPTLAGWTPWFKELIGETNRSGWKAALIKRAGNDVLGVGPQPQLVGADLQDVADQLVARHKEMIDVA